MHGLGCLPIIKSFVFIGYQSFKFNEDVYVAHSTKQQFVFHGYGFSCLFVLWKLWHQALPVQLTKA